MKRDSVDRHAVPEDRLERFMGLVYSLVEPFGIEEVPEVYHYIELLGQAIERHIAESRFTGSPQGRLSVDRRKFISIFKNRYLSTTDLEYTRAITGIDGRLINQLNKALEDNGFEVDEYLTWLFDSFLSENPKFNPPSIKFACSNFAVEKFLYEHKDKIKQRREDKIRKKESMDLISRARILIRHYQDNAEMKNIIVDVLKGYRDGGIMLEKMRSEIERIEKSVRESQVENIKVGDGDGII
jgi:hypothetical protein